MKKLVRFAIFGVLFCLAAAGVALVLYGLGWCAQQALNAFGFSPSVTQAFAAFGFLTVMCLSLGGRHGLSR
jgi:hypothetical protein